MPTFLPLVVLLSAPLATQTGDADLLALVPPDAFAFGVTDRLDAIRARAAENAWGRFLLDERILGSSAADPASDEGSADAEAFDLWRRAWHTVDGRVAGFAVATGEEEAAAGLLIDAGARGEEVGRLLDDVLGLHLEAVRTGEEPHAGVALTVYETPDGVETAIRFHAGGVQGLIYDADPEDALALARATVDRALAPTGGAPLAAGAGFEAARAISSLERPALAVHVDLPGLLAAIGEVWATDDPEDAETRRWVHAIGFDRMEWLHLEADVGAGERLDFAFRAHVPPGTFLDRLTATFGPLPLDMLGRLPGDARSVTLAGFDVPAFWGAVRGLARDLGPEVEAELEEGLAELESGAGAEIEDLLAQITGRFAGFDTEVPAEEMPELEMFGTDVDPAMRVGGAYLVGVPPAGSARDLVARALAQAGMEGMVEQTTVAGVPAAVLSFGPFFSVRWAFLEDAVLISRFPTPFRMLLERQGRTDGSAAEHAGFARESRAFQGALYLTMTDTASAVRTLLSVVPMLTMLGMPGPDVPLLESPPDPAIAQEYFRGTTAHAAGRNGASFEIVLRTR